MSISMGGGPVMASLYAVDGTAAAGVGFDDALVSIREAAVRHGKFAGIAVASGDAAHLAAEDGFDFVAIGGDSSFLHEGPDRNCARRPTFDAMVGDEADRRLRPCRKPRHRQSANGRARGRWRNDT